MARCAWDNEILMKSIGKCKIKQDKEFPLRKHQKYFNNFENLLKVKKLNKIISYQHLKSTFKKQNGFI